MRTALILMVISFVMFPFFFEAQSATVGDIVTDFTLEDVDGNDVSLYDYEDYVIFINYFGIFCSHCSAEVPYLENNIWQYYNELGGNSNDVPVVVLGLTDLREAHAGSNGDYDQGYINLVNHIANKGITYPVLIEDEARTANHPRQCRSLWEREHNKHRKTYPVICD